MDELVVVRGCGDIGTGVMHRLFCSGFKLVGLDIDKPTAIRRQVAFAQALYDGSTEVEGISAVKIDSPQEALGVIAAGQIPLLNDPNAVSLDALRPGVLIDAALAKRNLGTHIGMAPIVIALGPGFYAGRDAHAVIETNRGHNLGRVIYVGSAAAPTGTPGKIGGFGAERLIRAPATGAVRHEVKIGNLVQKGDLIAHVGGTPVFAPLADRPARCRPGFPRSGHRSSP